MKILAVLSAMIACTVVANLLMKTGAAPANGVELSLLARLASWRVLLGLSFFGAAAVLYVVILGWLPLSVAQSFAAAQFIAVILASWLVLAESIDPRQWTGMALIALGISVIGWTR